MTPTNVDDYAWLLRDPITGKWIMPTLTFNPRIVTPYFEVDYLNEDPVYKARVIDHIHTRLTEKWLYADPIFRKLLKYFKIEKKNDKGEVSLITDLEKTSDINKFEKEDRRYIFKYIEKYFISEHFVNKILRAYVSSHHVKWYDLFNNSDRIKELFYKKLKNRITETIYKLKK
uniref:Uncharacterized protein n=1 Tax=viral metagenome TaxID=1070528 RepID=A0A6C0LT96_9ZZZZ